MIPFTALRNFEFFSRQASAAARSKPESCFVGASNLLCGLGGGWSGDRAACLSNAASSAAFWRLFWRLWGGDPALGRLWGGDPADPVLCRNDMAARRADGVSTLLHKVDWQTCGAAQSRCDCAMARQRCARNIYTNVACAATSAGHDAVSNV